MKSIKGIIFTILLVGIVAVNLVGGMLGYGHQSDSPSTRAPSATRHVIYQVTTNLANGYCHDFNATYEMPSGAAQKDLQMCKEVAIVDHRSASPGDFVYLSVQNDNAPAAISCEIYVDNKLLYRTTSQGRHVIASCSGTVD